MANPKNFGALPAAPAGKTNVIWQADAPNVNPAIPRNVSAYYTPGGGGGAQTFAQTARRTALITHDGASELATAASCQGENLVGAGGSWSAVESETSAHGVGSSRYDSSADTYAGWYGQMPFRVGRNLMCALGAFLFRTADMRVWIGFNAAPGSLPASGAPSQNYAAFRFSSIDGDTDIQCATCDGTTQTIVNSLVAADLNHHDYAIEFDDSTPAVKFYIDKNLVATITTHLPTGVLHSMILASWHSSSPGAMIGGEYFNIQSDC